MIFRTALTAVLVMQSASMYAGEPVKYLDGQAYCVGNICP